MQFERHSAEYFRDWRNRRRAARAAQKEIVQAAIDRLVESASRAGPDVAAAAREQASIAHTALEAA